jgi:hypothetical protein
MLGELTSRQLAEWMAFERAEGFSLGARGDWERAAMARAGVEPRKFLRWQQESVKPFKDFAAHNPHFYRRRKAAPRKKD